jgi:cytochrome c oxidase assembly protein subunit 11
MPVSFYIDPAIIDDREAKFVKSITLSYTFYEIDLQIEELALNSDKY